MSQDASDELGPPPDKGLVVRPEEDGFYVRLHPIPAPQGRIIGGIAAGFGLLGAIIAYVMSSEMEVVAWVAVGSTGFGVLLYALSYGAGFFPVELIGDARCLAWGGDRFMWSQISGCDAEGGTLRLRMADGRVVAEAKHLDPAAAAWTARLVTLSIE